MSVHFRGFLFLSLLFVVSFCNADQQTIEVVGVGECADCKENHFNENEAFSGLRVTIDCKSETGGIKRFGTTELDEQGKFKLQLPQEAVEQAGQKLKQECYAQLHNAADAPCPTHGSLETTKITFKSHENGKFIFGPVKPLQFSTSLCTSKFLWKKKFPKLPFPPVPIYEPKPKLLPPPIPVHKPKPKPEKPILPPAPVHKPKPKPPVVKPLPPPIPVHKPEPKPKKPSKPEDKPKPKPSKPADKPKPKPKPKPPVIKPLPPPIPLFPIPPIHKKPLPKIPPKYFHHPKIGYFPPPAIPHP